MPPFDADSECPLPIDGNVFTFKFECICLGASSFLGLTVAVLSLGKNLISTWRIYLPPLNRFDLGCRIGS